MSIADKLQRLALTKSGIKAAIELGGASLDGVPFAHYPYYIAPDKVQHPALVARYSAKGRSNQDANREVLPDLSGNGHDILLKNFAYSLMSGYGGFNGALTPTNKRNPNLNYKTITPNKIEVVGITKDIVISDTSVSNLNYFEGPKLYMTSPGKIKITIECDNPINLFIASEGTGIGMPYMTFANGTREIEHTTNGKFLYGRFVDKDGTGIVKATDSFKLTIEIPNDYPDGLVFDGIDDYTSLIPVYKNKGTVLFKFKSLDINKNDGAIYMSPKDDGITPWVNSIVIQNSKIRMNGDTSNNQLIISIDDSTNTTVIYWDETKIGCIYKGINKFISSTFKHSRIGLGRDLNSIEYGKFILYDMVIYDRTLTESEIQQEILKYNL